MSQTTTLETLQTQAVAPRQRDKAPVAMSFFNMDGFELMQRIAKAFSQADLVPKQYQGNLPNCMIALDMAQRMGANPLMVMQNLYIVHGTPGWSSKFLIATVNTCGRFSSMRYEWKGEPGSSDYGCRAWAIEKSTGERLDGIWVTWKMVNDEGWAAKNGSKWKTMPDQMFIYRAAAFWQRAYAPDLGMGLQTAEELQDVIDAKRDADGSFTVDLDVLRRQQEVTDKAPGAGQQALEHEPGEVIDTVSGEITKSAQRQPADHQSDTGDDELNLE
ncbi:TPA: hypothetical protein ACJIUU_005452 [Pseudomonas aeruginosa]|uniref:hypothetical protein n=1 Tax=Pseudomonas aeruginosa TaxID=287 RepID=UPI000F845F30|nr:hypothetical protein [Pseudomonas aeruginosa]MBG6342518.1 hypothetical protein [Pseudomonas aeruginosa]RTX46779.1 hypothetical protein DZA23_32085 [Pseudomonas aeruginosa]HBO0305345.1 hypothetical protein [Pseudomonas aeruginosa]HBO5226665.1 hypothetical protein [Pseudomonas aeruginosa]HBP1192548.1 recombinase RecT [Pseudomonas aeruginosa]